MEGWPNAPDWIEERALEERWAPPLARGDMKVVAELAECLEGWKLQQIADASGELRRIMATRPGYSPRFAHLDDPSRPFPTRWLLIELCREIRDGTFDDPESAP